ncbi:MAG: hypothetical protein EOO06_03355 [Chitinophagaceae bacterium]|nr:MAG: hypothetical protein EOO06_03355 [Chitinophagaceae bacterium]
MQASILIDKRQLNNELARLLKLQRSQRRVKFTTEVVLFDGYIKLVVPGAEQMVQAITEGNARFSMLLWYFADLIQAQKERTIKIELKSNEISVGGITITTPVTFYETDRILRSINLPVNYTDRDLVRLYLSEKYTYEEIQFNKLDKRIKETMDQFNTNVDKAATSLTKYGITRDEIIKMISETI